MFGESNSSDVNPQGHSKAAAMADTDEFCGCNGITKGTICQAIKDRGLFTRKRCASTPRPAPAVAVAPVLSSNC